MKTESIKTEYVTDDSGQPVDVRQLPGAREHLAYFTVTQGACSDGKNIYMVFERKEKDGRTQCCRIVKLDAKTFSVVRVSGELSIGHGNGMTYHDGTLYVTNSSGIYTKTGKSKDLRKAYSICRVIHTVDAETLRQGSDIKVRGMRGRNENSIRAFNGIAYEKDTGGFLLRCMWRTDMIRTDSNFVRTGSFRIPRLSPTSRFGIDSQSMDWNDGKIYRAYSMLQSTEKNYIAEYDRNGRLITRLRLDMGTPCELESVFFIGNTMYGTVYKRDDCADGTCHCHAYLIRIRV